jgi:hypothetical protein
MPRPDVTTTPLLTALIAATISCLTLLRATDLGHVADGDFQIDTKSFRCITKMTPVRHFYVDNVSPHFRLEG